MNRLRENVGECKKQSKEQGTMNGSGDREKDRAGEEEDDTETK